LLEHALEQVRDQWAAVREITRPAAVDDYVSMNLTVKEGATIKQHADDVVMKIGDRSFPDEVNRILVGARKNEQKEASVNAMIYSMKIKKVEERQRPVITDEFARTKGFDDVEDLKKKLLEEAKAYEEKRQEEDLKEKLSRILLERTKFPVPSSMTDLEYRKILQRMNAEDSESNRERFLETAEKRARLNLILDWIARKENIAVNDEDITRLTSSMGIKVDKDNKPDIENYIKNMVIREKTLDLVYKHARVSEKSRILSPKEAQNDTHTVRH
jgi:trigger factor